MLKMRINLIKIFFTVLFLFVSEIMPGQIYRIEVNYRTNKIRLFLVENVGKKRLVNDKIYSLCSAPYLKNIQVYVLENKSKQSNGRLKLMIEAEIEISLYKINKQKESLSLSFFCKENGRITTELSLTQLSDQMFYLIENLIKKRL